MDYYFEEDGAAEPIDLAQAKTLLGIDFDWKDSEIKQIIRAAREQAETYTSMSILKKKLVMMLDDSFYELSIPFPPFLSLDSVKAFGKNGQTNDIPLNNFEVYKAGYSSGMVVVTNSDCFNMELRSRQGIVLESTVGFESGKCPAAFLDAMNLYIQCTYDRVPFEEWKSSFYALLQKWRIINI